MKKRMLLGTLLTLLCLLPSAWWIEGKVQEKRRDYALVAAIYRDDVAAVKTLLAEGANIEARDTGAGRSRTLHESLRALFGRSPSRHAPTRMHRYGPAPMPHSGTEQTAIEIALTRYTPEPNSASAQIVAALLERGADPNAVDSRYGMNSLMHAAYGRDMSLLRLALEKGATIGSGNFDGRTALHFAANSGFREGVAFLLEQGADINAFSQDGSPLMSAIWGGNGRVARFLMAKGADPLLKDKSGRNAFALAARDPNKKRWDFLLQQAP